MKQKIQPTTHYTYSFNIKSSDEFPIRVIINRDDVPYCQFLKGEFLNPNGLGKKVSMSSDEKISIWWHINKYGNAVNTNTLELDF